MQKITSVAFLRSRVVNILVKILLFALMAWAIYWQIDERTNGTDLWNLLRFRFTWSNVLPLLMAVLFVPLNWGFETKKFQELTRSFLPYPYRRLYQSVLAGVAVSILTPNRIGEYAGRILLVDATYNWRTVIATLVSSLAQLVVLLGVGILGFGLYAHHFELLSAELINVLLIVVAAFAGVLFFFLLNVDQAIVLARRLPINGKLRQWIRPLRILKYYSQGTLLRTLGYAFSRYAVYSFQYYLILSFFLGSFAPVWVLPAITTIFLIQTSIPLPALTGLASRGAIALTIFQVFGLDDSVVLITTVMLYLVNLAIPALLGGFFILRVNILRSLGWRD